MVGVLRPRDELAHELQTMDFVLDIIRGMKREEKALGRPYSSLPVLKGGLQERWGGTLYQGV